MQNIKDHKNLKKDTATGTIINVDKTAYENYMTRAKLAVEKENRIFSLEKEVKILKKQMHDILKYIEKEK